MSSTYFRIQFRGWTADGDDDERVAGPWQKATTPAVRQPARERARRAIAALHPSGVPDAATLPNKVLYRDVCWHLDPGGQRRWLLPSINTVLRAAGRRS